MQLTTPVHINPLPVQLGYRQHVLLMGSCFATGMGERMRQLKLTVNVNPFGVLYNPLSLAAGLRMLMEEKPLTVDDLQYANGLWFSFYHHGSFSHPDRDEALARINAELARSAGFLKKTDTLILTLGTAYVYEHKRSGMVVSNCHKLPAGDFERRMMSVDEVYGCLSQLLSGLTAYRKGLKATITVSPIRHLKDGAHANQLSKATLLLAVDRLCRQFDSVAYFPAYEILLDELRDYRFYADDMLHPSEKAADYIWQRFEEAAFAETDRKVMSEIDKVIAAYHHRPFNPDTEQHRTFLASFYQKVLDLQKRFPDMDLESELRYFSNSNSK